MAVYDERLEPEALEALADGKKVPVWLPGGHYLVLHPPEAGG